MTTRRQQARDIRVKAAEHAYSRPHPAHANNGEEFLYRSDDKGGNDRPIFIANFTKGLPHNGEGFLCDPSHYERFVLGIQSGNPLDFERTPLGPLKYDPKEDEKASEAAKLQPGNLINTHRQGVWKSHIAKELAEGKDKLKGADVRAWESAGAGHTFDLEGPDAQAVTMPPAPRLDSDELIGEMAEVYLMALLRDVPFALLRDKGFDDLKGKLGTDVSAAEQAVAEATNAVAKASNDETKRAKEDSEEKLVAAKTVLQRTSDENSKVEDAVATLNSLDWFKNTVRPSLELPARVRHRSDITVQNLFRGVAPGDAKGPHLSQFLLLGNKALGNKAPGNLHEVEDGYITYGSIRIDQRVRTATPGKDYMTTFAQWLDVQNGADLRGMETYKDDPDYRFMATPRDLATYVHYDALYEAYLNACLLLLAIKAPFDPGIPFQAADNIDKQQGFAQFGGPHILSLVTEVATRALKAVRYQKFNVHRRARPEAIGGLVHRQKKSPDGRLAVLNNLVGVLGNDKKAPFGKKANGTARSLLDAVAEHNTKQNSEHHKSEPDTRNPSYLLPMAFPEGSPMHPAYGAGHATVAGACVTILKAYFDHGFNLSKAFGGVWEPAPDGTKLIPVEPAPTLTVEGELNKVASNIAIGRDWAGVHYFTDYIESLRLGEQIALGLLEEQKLTYSENFTMTVPLFEGNVVRI